MSDFEKPSAFNWDDLGQGADDTLMSRAPRGAPPIPPSLSNPLPNVPKGFGTGTQLTSGHFQAGGQYSFVGDIQRVAQQRLIELFKQERKQAIEAEEKALSVELGRVPPTDPLHADLLRRQAALNARRASLTTDAQRDAAQINISFASRSGPSGIYGSIQGSGGQDITHFTLRQGPEGRIMLNNKIMPMPNQPGASDVGVIGSLLAEFAFVNRNRQGINFAETTDTRYQHGTYINPFQRLPIALQRKLASLTDYLPHPFSPSGTREPISFQNLYRRNKDTGQVETLREAYTDPQGNLLGSRDRGALHGFNLRRTFGALVGAINLPGGGLLNFKGGPAGPYNPGDAAKLFKAAQDSGMQPYGTLWDLARNAPLSPTVSDPVIQYDEQGKALPSEPWQVAKVAFSTRRMPAGQAYVTRPIGMMEEQLVEFGVPTKSLRPDKLAGSMEIIGRKQPFSLYKGETMTTGDWIRTNVTPFEIIRSGAMSFVSYAIQKVAGLGDWRIKDIGLKTGPMSLTDPARFGLAPEDADIIASPEAIKNDPAVLSRVFGGVLASGTDAQRAYLNLPTDDAGRLHWTAENLDRIMAATERLYQRVPENPFWKNDNLVLPMLVRPTRSGVFTWTPRLRQELAAVVANIDRRLFNFLSRVSGHKRSVYGEVINSAMEMLSPGLLEKMGGKPFGTISVTKEMLSGISTAAKAYMGEAARPDRGAMYEAVRGLALDYGFNRPFLAKLTFGKNTYNLRLASIGALDFFGGDEWMKSLAVDDDEDSRDYTANVVQSYWNKNLEIWAGMASGTITEEQVKSFLAMQKELVTARGIHKGLTSLMAPHAFAGPYVGDFGIPKNVVALPDELIREVALRRRSKVGGTDDEKFRAYKEMLSSGVSTSLMFREPGMFNHSLITVINRPLTDFPDREVVDPGKRHVLHPDIISLEEGDTDSDSSIHIPTGTFDYYRDEQGVLRAKWRPYARIMGVPISPEGIGALMSAVYNRIGMGAKEARKSLMDWQQWSTADKMSSYLLGRARKIFSADNLNRPVTPEMLQDESGWMGTAQQRMGQFFNLQRWINNLTNFAAQYREFFAPGYQVALDKLKMSKGLSAIYSLMTGSNMFSGGVRPVDPREAPTGLASLMREAGGKTNLKNIPENIMETLAGAVMKVPGEFRDEEGGVAHGGGGAAAFLGRLFLGDKLWSAVQSRFRTPEQIRRLYPRASDAVLQEKLAAENLRALGTAVADMQRSGEIEEGTAGQYMYDQARTNPLWAMMRAMLVLRASRQPGVGTPGHEIPEHEQGWLRLGRGIQHTIIRLSQRFDDTSDIAWAYTGLRPDNPALWSSEQIAFGATVGRNLNLMPGFTNWAEREPPIEGRYDNPALSGPRGTHVARIEHKEGMMLRGLEAIARRDPQKARRYADSIIAEGGMGMGGVYHGASYQNPNLDDEFPPPYDDPYGAFRRPDDFDPASLGQPGGPWERRRVYDREFVSYAKRVSAADAEERWRRLRHTSPAQASAILRYMARLTNVGGQLEAEGFSPILSTELAKVFGSNRHVATKIIREMDLAVRGKSRRGDHGELMGDALELLEEVAGKLDAAEVGLYDEVRDRLPTLEAALNVTGGRKGRRVAIGGMDVYSVFDPASVASGRQWHSPEMYERFSVTADSLSKASERVIDSMNKLATATGKTAEQEQERLKAFEKVSAAYESLTGKYERLDRYVAKHKPAGMPLDEWMTQTEEGKIYTARRDRLVAREKQLDRAFQDLLKPQEGRGLFGDGGPLAFMNRLLGGFQLFYYNRLASVATGAMQRGMGAFAQNEMANTQGLYRAGMLDGSMPGAVPGILAWQNQSQRAWGQLGAQTWATYGVLLGGSAGLPASPAVSWAANVGLPAVGAGLLANAVGSAAGGVAGGGLLGTLAAPAAFPIIVGSAALLGTANWVRGQFSDENRVSRLQTLMTSDASGVARSLRAASILGAPGLGIYSALGISSLVNPTYSWARFTSSQSDRDIGAQLNQLYNNYPTTGLSLLQGLPAEARGVAVQGIASRYFPSLGVEQASAFLPALNRYGNLPLDTQQRLAFMYSMGTDPFRAAQQLAPGLGISPFNYGAQTPLISAIGAVGDPSQIDTLAAVMQQYPGIDSALRRLGMGGGLEIRNGQISSLFAGLALQNPQRADFFYSQVMLANRRYEMGLPQYSLPGVLQAQIMGPPTQAELQEQQYRSARTNVAQSIYQSAAQLGLRQDVMDKLQRLADTDPRQAQWALNRIAAGQNPHVISGYTDADAASMRQSNYDNIVTNMGQSVFNMAVQRGVGLTGASTLGGMVDANPQLATMANAILSGDPIAMSLAGQVGGNNSLITVETGKWGGTRGQGLFTTTMGYGSRSPDQVINTMFRGRLSGELRGVLKGYTNMFGKTYGGIWGLQDYMADLSYQSSMISAGAAISGARRDIAFTTGEGISAYTNRYTGQPFTEGRGYWTIEDEMRDLSRRQQREQLELGRQGSALSLAHFLENWNFNRNMAVMQRGWQVQDFAFQQMQMLQQRGWTREDWSFEEAQRNRQFGWAMEDIDENIRFATGRERRLLMRQRDRMVISRNEEEGRVDTLQRRQEQLWKQEDERFDIQRKRADELHRLQLDRMDMEKRHFMERQSLEEGHREKQLRWMEERESREDELREMQRTQWELDKEHQINTAGAQAGIAKKMREAQEAMKEINREQDKQTSSLRYRMIAEVDWYEKMAGYFERLADWAEKGMPGNPPPGPAVLFGAAGQGGSTTSSTGDDMSDYERGPGNGGRIPLPGYAAGFQGLVTGPTHIRGLGMVAEAQPEWVTQWLTVTPHNPPVLPTFDFSNPGNGVGGGDVTVLVYLDSEPIAARVEKRQGPSLARNRRR